MAEATARVLFVEDDDALAGIVVRHLRARGHDARSVGSAEEAQEAIAAGFVPTIVLLDINLPGASGWEWMRSSGLRAAGSPPVYVVTATSVPPARLREFGVAGFLPKPFALTTLIEVVDRCAAAARKPAPDGIPVGGDTPDGGLDGI
jgi:two-component system KDP operon response regulator KdpE